MLTQDVVSGPNLTDTEILRLFDNSGRVCRKLQGMAVLRYRHWPKMLALWGEAVC